MSGDKFDLGNKNMFTWCMSIIELKIRNDIDTIRAHLGCDIKEAGDKMKSLIDKIVEKDEK